MTATQRWIAPVEGDELRPIRLGLSLLGLVFLAASFIPLHGFDLYAYWTVGADPYARTTDAVNASGSFWYAPPLIVLMDPLGLLPWEAVVIGWLAIQLAALWYIGRRWALVLIVFPPVWLDIVYGNINILLAAMIVAGFRRPAVWTFALLTKVTPTVGLLWFLVRREWRALAEVAAVTAIVSVASIAVLGTSPWFAWVDVLTRAGGTTIPPDALPIPVLPRLVVAAVIVGWAGYTDRRWLVPVGVTLAMPLLWVITFAPLVACWALVPPATAERIRNAIVGWSFRGQSSRS